MLGLNRMMLRLLCLLSILCLSACACKTTDIQAGSQALVDLATLDPGIIVDMKYATADNFTGKVVYPVGKCLLRKDIAERLVNVQRDLKTQGYGLKVLDCYRPFSVQKKFWEIMPDENYVLKPVEENGKMVKGSKHNRGAAVDLTLVDAKGREMEMPTAFDDFTEKAHRDYKGATPAAKANQKILEKAMQNRGFELFPSEWWHFDGPGWQNYPLMDVPLK